MENDISNDPEKGKVPFSNSPLHDSSESQFSFLQGIPLHLHILLQRIEELEYSDPSAPILPHLKKEALRFFDFELPSDRNAASSTVIFIPTKEYPTVNFIGQLLGPEGTHLKKLESLHSVKIKIEGGIYTKNKTENLHVIISGEDKNNVNQTEQIINTIIEQATENSTEIYKDKEKEASPWEIFYKHWHYFHGK